MTAHLPNALPDLLALMRLNTLTPDYSKEFEKALKDGADIDTLINLCSSKTDLFLAGVLRIIKNTETNIRRLKDKSDAETKRILDLYNDKKGHIASLIKDFEKVNAFYQRIGDTTPIKANLYYSGYLQGFSKSPAQFNASYAKLFEFRINNAHKINVMQRICNTKPKHRHHKKICNTLKIFYHFDRVKNM